MRTRSTFMKRQKELARQQKQRDKAARRQQRKTQRPAAGEFGDESAALEREGFAGDDALAGTEEDSARTFAGEEINGGAASLGDDAAIQERKETP